MSEDDNEDGGDYKELEMLHREYEKKFIEDYIDERERIRHEAYLEAERTNQPVKLPSREPWPDPWPESLDLSRYSFDSSRTQAAIHLLKSILAGERGPLTKEDVKSFEPDFSWVDEHNEKNPDDLILI